MKNTYTIDGDVARVLVRRRDGEIFTFLIDAADIPHVASIGTIWQIQKNIGGRIYVRTRANSRITLLHRWLLDAPPRLYVDHINGDGLNNRRCNLRLTTPTGNSLNRNRPHTENSASGLRGVYWDHRLGKWFSKIEINDHQHYLGYFSDKYEASRAFEGAAADAIERERIAASESLSFGFPGMKPTSITDMSWKGAVDGGVLARAASGLRVVGSGRPARKA